MIGIYVNSAKDDCKQIADRMCLGLKEHGCDCCLISRDFKESIDLVIVIGGDGTVLDIVQNAVEKDVPILSLNAGGVGFLSCFEIDEVDKCIQFILKNEFETDDRPLLVCKTPQGEFYALNEVSLQRSNEEKNIGCTVELSLKIEGEFADKFRADGLIIATPTGSTAYSLSAGGAILTPGLNAFIATPICAHTLSTKPIVFSSSATAEITLSGRNGGDVYCDGKFCEKLSAGDKIVISNSGKNLKFVKGQKGFFNTLFKKLTSWSEK